MSLAPSSSSRSFIARNKGILLSVATVAGVVFSLIPAILVTLTMFRVYTVVEGTLAAAVAVFPVGASIVALVALKRKSALLYLMLFCGFVMILAGVFMIFNPLWGVIAVIEGVGVVAAKKSTTPERRLVPRFRSKQAIAMLVIAGVSVTVPVAVYFNPPEYVFTVEMKPAQAGKNLEINFALANISVMPDDLLDILTRCNALPGINVSLEIPILEELIMNTTKLVGVPFPNRSAMVKPYAEYSDCSDYKKALTSWEKEWKRVADLVRDNITALSYDELRALPDDYFDQNGLVVNQTKRLATKGIAVDYMPLLGESTYVNDITVDRINKTLTLMKRFIEINHLETAHRGLVFDTERAWGQDLELILQYYNYSMHATGIKQLGQMVGMCKQWEYEWKNLESRFGAYSDEIWRTQVVTNRITYVGSATFGIHIDDLWDLDDTQQNLFKISIVTEAKDPQFDFIGIMTYEQGEFSDQAVYSYCRAGDFFFGNANVPYIYSGLDNLEDYKDDPVRYVTEITKKFRIAQNYGYTTVGMWGLTSLYCYSECGSGWCGGFYDFLQAFHNPEAIFWMCQNLSTPESVTFTCKSFKFAWTHPALTILDYFLFSEIRYSPNWPINNNSRIRPEEFW